MSVSVGGQIPAQIWNEKILHYTNFAENFYQEDNVIAFTDDLYQQQMSLSLHLRYEYGTYTIDLLHGTGLYI